jgi:CheY-like chemotaxis protein
MESDKRRVLVVEDNPEVAETLRRLLAACGYDVAVAHTGQEGLRAARRLEPHVVLCDIELPDENGYIVGSVLRESGCPAKLIAVTGRGAANARRHALAAGFHQHLAKPVNADLLLRELVV